jgi:sucrose-6-phosphate hydrolase SacC (GH32 family)
MSVSQLRGISSSRCVYAVGLESNYSHCCCSAIAPAGWHYDGFLAAVTTNPTCAAIIRSVLSLLDRQASLHHHHWQSLGVDFLTARVAAAAAAGISTAFVLAGWQFDGFLAAGDNKALGLRGNDWECPILAQLPSINSPPPLATLPALNSSSSSGVGTAAAKQQLILDSSHAAAVVADVLEPSISQQLLLAKLHKRGVSSMGSLASASSLLLGVGHYPAGFAAAGCDSETTVSSSVSEYSPVSEVSSSSGGGSSSCLAQQADVPSVNSPSSSGSSSSIVQASECAPALVGIQATVEDAAVAAAAAAGVDSYSSSIGAVALVMEPVLAAATVTDAVAGADNSTSLSVVAPLTEPVLAAATAATEAAAAAAGNSDPLVQQHPSSNLYAWLEQTPEPAALAAAEVPDTQASLAAAETPAPALAAAAAVALASGSSSLLGDAVVLLDDGCSSSKEDLLLLQHPEAAVLAADNATTTTTLSSSSSGSRDWFFCISPEACNFPITWWLGSYDGSCFDVAAADGPHKLDLGTTLYAATLWKDPQVK